MGLLSSLALIEHLWLTVRKHFFWAQSRLNGHDSAAISKESSIESQTAKTLSEVARGFVSVLSVQELKEICENIIEIGTVNKVEHYGQLLCRWQTEELAAFAQQEILFHKQEIPKN